MVQIDTAIFGDFFALTAIDIVTKESAVLLYPDLEATDGQAFLHKCMAGSFDGHVKIIQTDGSTGFKRVLGVGRIQASTNSPSKHASRGIVTALL